MKRYRKLSFSSVKTPGLTDFTDAFYVCVWFRDFSMF